MTRYVNSFLYDNDKIMAGLFTFFLVGYYEHEYEHINKNQNIICRCDKSVTDGGNLVSGNSLWQTTGRLVTRLTLPDSEALCSRDKSRINAFLPLSRLTRSHCL